MILWHPPMNRIQGYVVRWMRQSYAAATISPTSLEVRPCMCNDRCESALFHPAHAYCGTLSSLAAPLHHSPDPSRASLHPALIPFAALCTPSTGPPVRPVLAHTLERAAHYRASGPDGHCMGPPSTLTDPRVAGQGPCLAHLCGAGCAHTAARLQSGQKVQMESPKNCLIRLCRTERKELLTSI